MHCFCWIDCIEPAFLGKNEMNVLCLPVTVVIWYANKKFLLLFLACHSNAECEERERQMAKAPGQWSSNHHCFSLASIVSEGAARKIRADKLPMQRSRRRILKSATRSTTTQALLATYRAECVLLVVPLHKREPSTKSLEALPDNAWLLTRKIICKLMHGLNPALE